MNHTKQRTVHISPPSAPAASPSVRYDPHRGLGEEEIRRSREVFGDNMLTKKKKDGFLKQFFRNFNDPIIRILLGALGINILLTLGHVNWLECGGIAAAVLISTLVSTLSEFSSAAAFETLCETADDTAVTVRREGEIRQIRLSEVVVGDTVLLSGGATVPADGILLFGNVTVDQSPLTGESEEKAKGPQSGTESHAGGVIVPDSLVWDPDHGAQLFRGSRVCQGDGGMLVGRVGDATLYGSVASGLQESARPSPLKERLTGLARSVSFLGYVAAAIIAFAYLFNVFVIDSGMDPALIRARITDPAFALPQLIRALTVAISILVVAVPEGLPMMITVVLSSNMKKMLRAGVLVRRLVGIETAGNLNILFTDKTGTLTCGKLKVASIVSADTSFDSITSLKKSPAFYSALRQNHLACTGTGRGNATDRAVSAFFSGCGGDRPRVLHRVPFDSARRYSSGCVEDRTLIRGAPEVILPQVTRYLAADGRVRPMTPAVMAKLRREWQEYAAGSHRVIAAAEYDGLNTTDNGGFADLIFVALIAIRDRLRPDAADAVATARQAGIQTVMITGDNPLTAEAIARECGIIAPGGPDLVLTGEMLSRMTDEEVSAKIPRIAVVARALPTDKSRLVRLSQQRGLVVGMTGDGINDAPALRAADVGFAMGSGTDAAREAGDIVITDDRFSSIMQAVLYGRTIFLSIRKFIVFQLTMNLCAVGVSLIGPFIGVETPVTVIQMLWVNIIMDTLGALAFAGEPSLAKYMHRPPLSREEKLLSPTMIQNILGAGGFSLALCLWFLKSPLMHRVLDRGDEVYYLTVFFASFIFCGLFNCFLSRTERMNIFAHLADNKPFILIVCTVCVVQLMIIYFGGDVFRCEPLTAREILIAALLAGCVLPAELLRRLIVRKRIK
ncbi:MAG: cation-translocating P-type ATPase [Clostridia bacterium]|nr:cation-translocating P-type ATPase [Clostridia bacterium]